MGEQSHGLLPAPQPQAHKGNLECVFKFAIKSLDPP